MMADHAKEGLSESRQPSTKGRSERSEIRLRSSRFRFLGFGILAISIGYFVAFASRHAAAITWPPLDGGELSILILAVFVATVALLSVALLWYRLLRAIGADGRTRDVLAAALCSHLGKYLPGNFGHYLARAALGRRAGVGLKQVVASMALEVVVLACCAGGLAAATWAASGGSIGVPDDASIAGRWQPAAWGLGILVLTAWILSRFGLGMANRIAGKLDSWPKTGRSELATAWLAALGFFLLEGIALGLVIFALHGNLPVPWLLPGIFAAAWLPGFLAPGIPGGLGIREAVLVALLTPQLGAGPALAVALLLRLVTVAGEGLAFVIGSLLVAGRAGSDGARGHQAL